MAYAIIALGGKQFKVQEGDTFKLERQSELKPEVLLYVDEDGTIVGQPVIEDISVKATVISEERDSKVRVARFRAKSRYSKVKGHRQPISIIKIESIDKKGKQKAVEAKKDESKKETVKATGKKVVAARTKKASAAKKVASSKAKEK